MNNNFYYICLSMLSIFVLHGGKITQTIKQHDNKTQHDPIKPYKVFLLQPREYITGLACIKDTKLLIADIFVGPKEMGSTLLFDTEKGMQKLIRATKFEGWARAFGFDHTKNRIFLASSDKAVQIFDINNKNLGKLEGHSDVVYSTEVSSDGAFAVTTSKDQTTRLWDFSGNTSEILQEHDHYPAKATISMGGNFIVSNGKVKGSLKLWNRRGQCIAETSRNILVGDKQVSSDGKRIVFIGWKTDNKNTISLTQQIGQQRYRELDKKDLETSIFLWDRTQSPPVITELKHLSTNGRPYILKLVNDMRVLAGSFSPSKTYYATIENAQKSKTLCEFSEPMKLIDPSVITMLFGVQNKFALGCAEGVLAFYQIPPENREEL